jgi:hypothetical protein
MHNFTGYYDRHGIPIHVGDLIRVEHYRHYRGRRLMWLYFRVAVIGSKTVVQNWGDLDASKHQCLIEHCGIGTAEVLAETYYGRDKNGDVTTFNERPRKKRNQ